MPGAADPRQPPVPPELQLPQLVDEAAVLTRYILASDPSGRGTARRSRLGPSS